MLFLMGVLALLLASPNANADDKEKYKLFAEETRKEIWALELPEFANTVSSPLVLGFQSMQSAWFPCRKIP